jgi:hypothetical protein
MTQHRPASAAAGGEGGGGGASESGARAGHDVLDSRGCDAPPAAAHAAAARPRLHPPFPPRGLGCGARVECERYATCSRERDDVPSAAAYSVILLICPPCSAGHLAAILCQASLQSAGEEAWQWVGPMMPPRTLRCPSRGAASRGSVPARPPLVGRAQRLQLLTLLPRPSASDDSDAGPAGRGPSGTDDSDAGPAGLRVSGRQSRRRRGTSGVGQGRVDPAAAAGGGRRRAEVGRGPDLGAGTS